jgi:hypothetical protein
VDTLIIIGGAGVAALGDPRHALSPGDSVGLPETEVQRRHSRGKVVYSPWAIGVLLAARSVWLLLAVSPVAVAEELWARGGELAVAAAFALKPVAPGRVAGCG